MATDGTADQGDRPPHPARPEDEYVAHEREGVELVKAHVAAGTRMFADETPHRDVLDAFFPVGRINHMKSYGDFNGKRTNWVEGYFSRFRRMVQWQQHRVSAKYLHQYAANAAWCRDRHRRDNGATPSGSLATR